MYKQLFILFTCTLFGFAAIAQVTIKGTVTSAEDGMGLPGVSVLQKGTTNGVATDIDGNYTLTVPDNSSIIIFSSIGMQTIEIPASQAGNLVMQVDSNVLDEVVVTALGIKREAKKLGYAMTEIKGDELAGKNTVNAVSALQGESAGVSIGSSDGGLFGNAKIQIRGISTLNSKNNQPIFVVDGVILENSVSDKSADYTNSNANDFGNILKNLNPDDFKSVSVLKGAAATALYGSRGINGVVLIETKNGKGSKGLGVSIKHSLGIDHVYKVPDIQYEYGSGTLAGYISYGKRKANGKYYRFDTNQFYTDADGTPTAIGASGLGFGPKLNGTEIIGYDKEKMSYLPQKNNVKDVYDLGINNNTSVALSGGNDKGHFYLSDSYNHRTGTLPNNSFERNALLFTSSYKLTDWLKAEASISFTNSTSKNPISDLAANFIDGTFLNYYDTEKYKNKKYWQAEHGGIPSNKYGDNYADVPGQGIWFNLYKNNKIRKEQVTRPIVRLTADIIENLSVTLEGNMNYYTAKYEEKNWGRDYANHGDKGYYQIYHSTDESKTGKLVFNYNKELFDELTGNFVLGGEIWKQEKSETKIETDGGLIVPGRFFLENSKKTKKTEGKIYGTKQINSAYFLASFAYQEKLFLDITGRNDWSSSLVYTNGSGNYSYFYPSVSSSWIFSQSLNLPEWFSFGKIRASWAQVGSDTAPYTINKGYTLKNYEIEGGDFIYTNGISTIRVDKNIKPERKNSFEIGADLRFFNNRLNFDAAYYDETITQQIGEIPITEESGYNKLLTNIGSLQNKGLELKISGKPIQTEDFEWVSTFNYWDNTTKIKKLHKDYGAYKVLGGEVAYGNFRVGSVAFEGGEYGILMSDSKPATWQSKDKDGNKIDDPRNGMKILTWSNSSRGARYSRSYEVEKVGKIQPDFEGSWKNSFTYKGISLSFLLDARFGGTMTSYSNRYGSAYGWLQTSLYGRDAEHGGVSWTSKYEDSKGEKFNDGIIMEGVFAEGQTATSPKGEKVNLGGLTYKQAVDKGYIEPTHASYYHYFRNSWGTGIVNDDWVSEVNYVALRDISIGYNFPKRIAKKVGMQNIYVALNAHNLGYLYNSLPNNLNPESFRGTTSSESFRERSFTPYTRTYTFTLKMDF